MKNKIAAILVIVTTLCLGAAACSSDADVANRNLSQAADNFEISRRISFYNGITGQNALVIEGMCSLNPSGRQIWVTCKTGPNEYRRHSLGLSDNMTYISEQLSPASVSTAHYRVFFRPSALIPGIELQR